MQRTLAIVLSVAFLAVGPAALAGRPPLVNFPGDGDLQATKADGETVAAQVEGTAAADIEYPPADIGETSFFSWLLPQGRAYIRPPAVWSRFRWRGSTRRREPSVFGSVQTGR